MDTNPFAVDPLQQKQTSTPSYLQQMNNPTYTGAISNMIKAIVQGNNEYRQRQGLGGFTSSGVGQPMNISPSLPQDPTNPLGTGTSQPIGFTPSGAPPAASTPDMGFTTSTPTPSPMPASFTPPPSTPAPPASGTPVGGIKMPQFSSGFSSVDPVTQALMSPIPGM